MAKCFQIETPIADRNEPVRVVLLMPSIQLFEIEHWKTIIDRVAAIVAAPPPAPTPPTAMMSPVRNDDEELVLPASFCRNLTPCDYGDDSPFPPQWLTPPPPPNLTTPITTDWPSPTVVFLQGRFADKRYIHRLIEHRLEGYAIAGRLSRLLNHLAHYAQRTSEALAQHEAKLLKVAKELLPSSSSTTMDQKMPVTTWTAVKRPRA